MKIGDFLMFHKLVAPALIKIVFWAGVAFLILATVYFGDFYLTTTIVAGDGTIVETTRTFSQVAALAALAGDVMAILIWRIVCEIGIAIFSINDRLGLLVELKKRDFARA